MDWNIVTTSGRTTLIVVDGTDVQVLPDTHPFLPDLITHLTGGGPVDEAWVRSRLRPAEHIGARLQRLSEHVTYDAHQLYYKGERLDNHLSRHIVRLINSGGGYGPFVAFLENIALNPSPKSRMHLFTWLRGRDFSITGNGMILGYKGVQATPDNLSVMAGVETVWVDQTPHRGHIPNPVGAVVRMDRALVNPDRDRGCSRGLHVGTWEYASGFGSRTLCVEVNPRHVVSVPRDWEFAKMRVEEYRVLGVGTARCADPYYAADGQDEAWAEGGWDEWEEGPAA